MARSYTGKGDNGETGLWGGNSILKSDPRIVAVGEIDEANAAIGVTASFTTENKILEICDYLQNTLFTLGAEISAASAKKEPPYKLENKHIEKIEQFIEELDSALPKLNAFILPSGSSAVTNLHLARSVLRRAERATVAAEITGNPLLIKFLNRSSSLLFSMARWLKQKEGGTEKNPSYN